MRLDTIIGRNTPTISCEFFPPKTDKGEENLWQCLEELAAITPDFVSVTYGAGGSTQERTRRIVSRIRQQSVIPPMAHLTCVGATRDQLASLLDDYRRDGLDNILALRGDPPQGADHFEPSADGFAHASDLVAFIASRGDFAIAVATYPEGHPESAGGMMDDVRYLKLKQDQGAIAAVTQYFFDNASFYRFREATVKAGVTIPIIPGIMPIGNFTQIARFSAMCGTTIPDHVRSRMEPLGDDLNRVQATGIELASEQCADLLANGVPGLHFYCLNKSAMTLAVIDQLGVRP
ncbi:MAG: methylenetetrahydrofolate reductase [NAD(P)H] [Mariprofundales bacterium]